MRDVKIISSVAWGSSGPVGNVWISDIRFDEVEDVFEINFIVSPVVNSQSS